MKAKSAREVFIRSGGPLGSESNRKGIIYPGFEVDVIDTVKGQSIEGNDEWYVDKNGDFYWSGGFFGDKKVEFKTSDILGFYRVADAWREGIRGANVNVAVIDSGASHPALAGHIDLPSSNAFAPVGDRSLNGHGTHITGLISSSEVNGTSYGFAPEATLTVYNHTVAGGGSNQTIVKRALDDCATRAHLHIVNLSYANPDPGIFAQSIAGLIGANKIIIAATGNSGAIGYPAKHPGVISVAAIDKTGKPINPLAVGSTLFARGDEIDSLEMNGAINRLGAGSSQACAVVSGILTLALSAYVKDHGHLPLSLHQWADDLIGHSFADRVIDLQAALQFARQI
jgi:hypothetical protein